MLSYLPRLKIFQEKSIFAQYTATSAVVMFMILVINSSPLSNEHIWKSQYTGKSIIIHTSKVVINMTVRL